MTISRIYHSIRLLMCRSSKNRASYLKKHNVLGEIGDGCFWGPWLLPLYPKMIKLHDNVHVHKSCKIVPHDFLNRFFSSCNPNMDFGCREKLGCIELMDNVYLSMNVIVLPNVRINKNCIISAGSVVASDIPENSIASGVPAKPIGQFDFFMTLRHISCKQSISFKNQHLPKEIAEREWVNFEKRREVKKI